MFVLTLILLFILKLKFPKRKSIVNYITERYGRTVLTLFRQCEKLDYKLKKIQEDLVFLQTCLENELTPTFVNFKLHNAHLRSGPLYKNFQKKLIHEEIRNKSSQKRIILNKQSLSLSQLQASTSWIDFKHFENLIFKSNDIKIKGVKETHSRKLFKFGLLHARENLTADQVIFNLSDKHLTTDEKEVLSHGLKFALPPKKLNYHHHFLNFEKLYNELRENII